MADATSQESHAGDDPRRVYLQMKGHLQRVLALPLEGKQDLFREILVGYLMEEHNYSEGRARRLVTGNEAAILVMLTEEQDHGLW